MPLSLREETHCAEFKIANGATVGQLKAHVAAALSRAVLRDKCETETDAITFRWCDDCVNVSVSTSLAQHLRECIAQE